MEAPTPVSALLHAATLVTAGIYLLIRVSPILEYSSSILLIITIIGSSTAFFAGSCGLVQNDLKRIIAFSTISQLGYMMMSIGLSQYNVALMHTINHAFFKALLFLGAGAVIHSFQDQQDIRKMGGLIKLLPVTYSVMLVGSLSLLATPFLTGFYSKDLILELAYSQYTFNGLYAYILGSLTAGITAFYSLRLLSLVFLTYPNGSKESYYKTHESNVTVILPLFILSIASICFGYLFSDLFVGIGSDFFGNAIFIHPNNICLVEAEFDLNPIIKLLPAIFTFIGAVSAYILYNYIPYTLTFNLTASKAGSRVYNICYNPLVKAIYDFLNGKYYFDVVYNKFIVVFGFNLGFNISKEIDRGIIELFGPYGLDYFVNKSANNLAYLDNGIITTYALYMTISLLGLLLLVGFISNLYDLIMFKEVFNLLIIFISAALSISFINK